MKLIIAVVVLAAGALLLAVMPRGGRSGAPADAAPRPAGAAPVAAESLAMATFAGGCFWCVEEAFDAVPGVVATTSGYIGGRKAEPTYEEVSAGGTGHAEAVQVSFDPAAVSYAELLDTFWRNIDPTTPDRQFCDRGEQYRAAIFYYDEEQKRLAEESKLRLEESGRFERVVTEIVPADQFWPAEEYHQDYYEKNPVRYKFYKFGCGREGRLEELWGQKG